jgi:hypothetical protein
MLFREAVAVDSGHTHPVGNMWRSSIITWHTQRPLLPKHQIKLVICIKPVIKIRCIFISTAIVFDCGSA